MKPSFTQAFRSNPQQIVHHQHVRFQKGRSPRENEPVQLIGDAHVTLTAPFYPTGDALSPHAPCVLPGSDDLDGTGAFARQAISFSPLLQGILTYEKPTVDFLTGFAGSGAWCDDARNRLGGLLRRRSPSAIDQVSAKGVLSADGYGAVAVTFRLPGGWDPRNRAGTLAAIGPGVVLEALARELRSMLLEPAERILRRCAGDEAAEADLPYYNITYGGRTAHPEPGRSALDDGLRQLLQPDSRMPLTSHSPWHDEFVFCGYGNNLIAAADPLPALEKLTLLLLVLDVPYARLARSAAAADAALQSGHHRVDLDWLMQVEQRLRSEYQSLVSPAFSFDHHSLLLRDAFLRSWDVARLQSLTDSLLTMLQQTVERQLAAEQARRIRRVNLVITVLTVLSAVSTVDAAVDLYHLL